MTEKRTVCNTCGGSGEIGFFQGESRFFITREECPACCGFGYILEEQTEDSGKAVNSANNTEAEDDGDH
jgi:DnaJ-class molecular chaperone